MSNSKGDTIASLGEKRLISEFVRPFFDGDSGNALIGDDCAILSIPQGHELLISTDRVPADLLSFKLGLINHLELGQYLAYLNISDIAACGGQPLALLLNMGVPADLTVTNFQDICRGFKSAASEFCCRIAGGDITSSSELSLSATSIGIAPAGSALRRSTSQPGDKVFTTRSLGLTPAAFAYHLGVRPQLTSFNPTFMKHQFTHIKPLIDGGIALRESGVCTSCMDNTDGVCQSLEELATESGVAIVVEAERIELDSRVLAIAALSKTDPIEFALGPGADFSLIGTIKKNCDTKALAGYFSDFRLIGHVETGVGIHVEREGKRLPLLVKGWNYFVKELAS